MIRLINGTKSEFKKFCEFCIDDPMIEFIGVIIDDPTYPTPELSIFYRESFEKKFSLFDTMYDDNLYAKDLSGVHLVGFACGALAVIWRTYRAYLSDH